MRGISKVLATIMMLMLAAAFGAGCTKSNDPNNGSNNNGNNGDGGLNGHSFVDLGLPSGTLWATCNVGATTLEGYGHLFAWGETDTKSTYNWSTYQYCNDGSNKLTKYCSDADFGYNGFTDNLIVLQPSDDAATVNWGGGWCTPTRDQWVELCTNVPNVWTTQNGKKGRLFTASNGQTLFLPAAGYCAGGFYDAGEDGFYWSSTRSTNYSEVAWYLHFTSGWYGTYDYDDGERCLGLSVRPVRTSTK